MQNNNKIAMLRSASVTFLLLLTNLFSPSSSATEGGGSVYPMGADNYLTGLLPPPGVYGLLYGEHYEADNMRDNNGDKLPIDFHAKVDAIVPRLIWVTDNAILGGTLAGHVMAPLADVKVRVNGLTQHKQGLGDMTFGAGLGYHYSENLHVVYGMDVSAPTGRYDRNDVANLGRNYWMFEPVAAITYIDPHGLNANLKVMYDFNLKNPDTDYKSGQEFHFDYAVGWAVTENLVLGVGGYAYQQTTDDKQNGDRIEDNKGRSFGIGPTIMYTSPNKWFFTAKWQQETEVRNRAQGNAYWLRLVFPL